MVKGTGSEFEMFLICVIFSEFNSRDRVGVSIKRMRLIKEDEVVR